MNNTTSLRNGFLVIVALLGIFFLYEVRPKVFMNNNVEMTVVKPVGQITSVTNARIIDYTRDYFITTIDFPENSEWMHKDIGPFGFKEYFFADFRTRMNVKKTGGYVFSVASDDGFQLWIDDKLLGEYINDRPFTTNYFNVYLEKGNHDFKLNYFQGYGRLGLVAFYQFEDAKAVLIGKNSGYIGFGRIRD